MIRSILIAFGGMMLIPTLVALLFGVEARVSDFSTAALSFIFLAGVISSVTGMCVALRSHS